MSLIFLPFTPPLSFTQATASRTPVANGLPTSAVMPVMSKMPPTLISCACAAPASAAAASSAIVLIVRFMTPPWPAWVLRCVRRLQSLSVREGVELTVVPDRVPPRGHAVRREEQEEHDREPEDPGLERREQVDELREGGRELARRDPEHLGQNRDEHRPEDRAEDRAEPADDDHPELVDRDRDREVLGADDVRVVGEQGARDADVERRHPEAEQLVLEDVHPHHLGGDVLVADRDERLPGLRAEEVLREQEQEHGDGEDEVEEAPVAVELEAAELRGRDGDAVHAARHAVPVRGGELDDEVGGERRHREVEPLEPEGGDAEDHPDERAHDPGERDHEEERQPHPAGEEGRRVGADGEERGVAERDLPGEAGEDVEPGRGDDGDEDPVQHVHPEEGQERGRERQRQQEQDEQPAGEARLEDRHVLAVRLAEIAAAHRVLPVRPQTRSILTLPNSPYGLRLRIATSAMNGATSFTPPPKIGSRYPPARFSRMPMTRPPTMAPRTESRPPRITTGITFRPKKANAPSTPPRIPPSSTPPIAETTAAMDQASAKMCCTETPIESATCCEKAVARIAMPARVYLKNAENRTSSTATLAML